MPPDPLFDRERYALQKLQQLVRERAAAESALAEAFRAAAEDADKDVQKTRKVIAAARKKATDDAAAENAAFAGEIADRYAAALQAAEKKRFDLRKRTVDQYSAGLEKTRSDYSDKLWTLDSVLEATEKETTDKHADFQRKAEAGRKRGEDAWGRAAPTLAKVRLPRESLTYPEDQLPPPDAGDPAGNLPKIVADADAAAGFLADSTLPRLTGVNGLGLFVLASAGLGAAVGFGLMKMPASVVVTVAGAVLGVVLWVVAGVLAKAQVKNRGIALGVRQAHLTRAARLVVEHAEATLAREKAENARKHEAARADADGKFLPRIATYEKQLHATLEKIDAEHAKTAATNVSNRDADATAEHTRFAELTAATTARFDAELAAAEDRFAGKMATATAARDAAFQTTSEAWFAGLADVTGIVGDLTAFAAARYPAWATVLENTFQFPADAPSGVRLGDYLVDLYALPDGMPFDPRLNPPEPLHRPVPALLPFPEKCSVLLKTRGEGRPAAVTARQAMMLRFLTGLPAGKVRFTIIDPVGLGENFAAFMHLADYDEKLVTARIWTEPSQIEQRLTDLTEHMENVIQKY
ncbi:MAG: hypothetical protein ACRC7O_13820, partial [Fimbriiglobus sp.]